MGELPKNRFLLCKPLFQRGNGAAPGDILVVKNAGKTPPTPRRRYRSSCAIRRAHTSVSGMSVSTARMNNAPGVYGSCLNTEQVVLADGLLPCFPRSSGVLEDALVSYRARPPA